MIVWLAILGGGMALLWPALANQYPILFSDTGGLLEMGLLPDMGWDKPWVYGPFLLGLHGRTTLWLPAFAQALLLSHMLWLAQKALGSVRPGGHLALCLGLALITAAPWFASLLMPDIFAPVAVLCVAVLGFGAGRLNRWELGWAAAVGMLAVASHLAHLVLAAGCLAAVWLVQIAGWPGRDSGPGRPHEPARPNKTRASRIPAGMRDALVRWRLAWRPALPLGGALAFLLLSNLIGHGALAVSPYGSLFMLARLIGDGPARVLLLRDCPAAGYERLCPWVATEPRVGWTDSDAFLWEPAGPVWSNNRGPILFAPEAARVVRATVLAYPGEVAAAMVRNAWRQLFLVRVGDALVPDHLAATVEPKMQAFFPPEELARYRAGVQQTGALPALAAPFAGLHAAVLVIGALGTIVVLARWRRDRALAGFAAVVLAGLAANAVATGALSGPHDRYQARIAWLVVLPPALVLLRRPYAASRATSAGLIRTSAS